MTVSCASPSPILSLSRESIALAATSINSSSVGPTIVHVPTVVSGTAFTQSNPQSVAVSMISLIWLNFSSSDFFRDSRFLRPSSTVSRILSTYFKYWCANTRTVYFPLSFSQFSSSQTPPVWSESLCDTTTSTALITLCFSRNASTSCACRECPQSYTTRDVSS